MHTVKKSLSLMLPVSAVTFLGFIDTHMLIPVIEWYAEELGASLAMAGIIIGVYSAVNTPVNIVFGRVVDRVGRRIPLTVGMVFEAVIMFTYSLSRTPYQLLLVRSLHGASGGVVGPSTMALVADQATENRKGYFMGFYGAAIGLAVLVGYASSGVIFRQMGVMYVFYIGSILLFIGFLLTFLVPGGKAKVRAVTIAGRRSSFVHDFVRLIRRRNLLSSYGSIFAFWFTFGGVVTLLPPYVRALKMTSFEFAMLLTIFCVIFITLQFPSGILSDRVGRKFPVVVGLLVASAGLCLAPLSKNFIALGAVMATYGVGYGLLFPSISALVVDNTDEGERGMGAGIFHSMLTLGTAVGAPVMGYVGGQLGLELGLGLTSLATLVWMVMVVVSFRKT